VENERLENGALKTQGWKMREKQITCVINVVNFSNEDEISTSKAITARKKSRKTVPLKTTQCLDCRIHQIFSYANKPIISANVACCALAPDVQQTSSKI